MKRSKKTILIVDDNQQNVQYLGTLLIEAGYNLSISQDATQTFIILENLIPDLIILDIMLPGINGYEICTRIKQDVRFKNTPILFNSSLFSIEDKVKAFEAGAVDFIVKPYFPQEIIKRIEVHLKAIHPQKQQESTLTNLIEQFLLDIKIPLSASPESKESIKLKLVLEELSQLVSPLP